MSDASAAEQIRDNMRGDGMEVHPGNPFTAARCEPQEGV